LTAGLQLVSVREALTQALDDAMAADERVIVLGEDIADPMGGSYKVTGGLSTKYGTGRVRNTPISEAAIVGAAVGAALVGLRPVAELMYIDFAAIAMDQIVNQAAFISYMSGGQLSVPIVIRCQGGGWRTSSAQHSKSLEAWFTHVPGLKFVMPSTASDAYWMLRDAIEDPNPVLFYEPNLLYREKGELDTSTKPGDLDLPRLVRAGDHATVVTWGVCIRYVLEAASILQEQGISLEIFDARQLAPINYAPITSSLKRTGLLLVVHEAWKVGGFGAEVAATLGHDCFPYLDGPVKRIGAKHCPHPFSPALEKAMLPSTEEIIATVREWF
jgi:acetoin:2,6-dichlorophenolindophenol oxidoreductase subunit beta